MKPDELIALNEEIAGMARAGLPLDQGLAALAKEMGRGRLRSVTAAIATDLKAGQTLPQALERQTGHVPPFYATLVSAGLRTGRISDVLATLTTYARTISSLRALIIEALFYPAVVLVFGLCLLGFLVVFVLPNFDIVFKDFGVPLPWVTEAVLQLSRQPFEYLLIPAIALVLLVVLVWLGLRFSKGGRLLWARFVYSVPLLGTVLHAARLAAFTELLAVLVDHEIPLPEAFRLAGLASSDPVMARGAEQIEQELNQGRPLGEVLRGRGLVPEWVSWMTALGERRGTLGQTLHQIADVYRRQVEMRAGIFRNVLPPFMIIVIAGLFVVLFVGVMMLPMIRMMEALSK
jgi:type II secretory pathway component PulF